MVILTSILLKIFFKQLTLRDAAVIAAHLVVIIFIFEHLIAIDI